MKKLTLICIAAIVVYTNSQACSSVWINYGKNFILGANLDGEGEWDGLVFINPRNVLKQTDAYNTGVEDLSWFSKYGSVTFNLVCLNYPQYGMNEEGLIVSTVSDPNTKGPEPDERPSMPGNFWLQYVLDVCRNTGEVKKSLEDIRIVPGSDRYIICDRNMNSMAVEFRDQRVVIYENESLPVNVVTNQSYTNCITHFKNKTLPSPDNIFDYITTKRFVTASNIIENYNCLDNEEGTDILFSTLKKIEGSPESIWRVVFDQSRMKISFITKQNKELRYLDFGSLDFECRDNPIMMDIDISQNGNTSGCFSLYSSDDNFKLYKSCMANVGSLIDDTEIKNHITFLEGFRCR